MHEFVGRVTLEEAKELITDAGDLRPTVTSLEVSVRFRNPHRFVVKAIEGLDCSADFYRQNFKVDTYRDRRDLEQQLIRMTRDGFSLLVMGFVGKQASFWRERYIEAFSLLEGEASRRAIERAETRGRAKTVRIAATDAYKAHGAKDWFHYVNNTDAIYETMFGGTARQLRRRWKLSPTANLRDHLTKEQLDHVILIENMVTLQLELRKTIHPDDQLKIVRHVAADYKRSLTTIIPGLVSSQAA